MIKFLCPVAIVGNVMHRMIEITIKQGNISFSLLNAEFFENLLSSIACIENADKVVDGSDEKAKLVCFKLF